MKKYIVILFALFVSCNTKNENKDTPSKNSIESLPTNNVKLDVSGTDSIECYFYKNPLDNKDFKKVIINNPDEIEIVLSDISTDTITGKLNCENDYKMFLYDNGDVYKTIYVSTEDSCNYIAYIINGNTFFVKLSKTSEDYLKKVARK